MYAGQDLTPQRHGHLVETEVVRLEKKVAVDRDFTTNDWIIQHRAEMAVQERWEGTLLDADERGRLVLDEAERLWDEVIARIRTDDVEVEPARPEALRERDDDLILHRRVERAREDKRERDREDERER